MYRKIQDISSFKMEETFMTKIIQFEILTFQCSTHGTNKKKGIFY